MHKLIDYEEGIYSSSEAKGNRDIEKDTRASPLKFSSSVDRLLFESCLLTLYLFVLFPQLRSFLLGWVFFALCFSFCVFVVLIIC